MHSKQGNMLEALRAIQEFLDDNGAQVGEVARNGTRRQLDAAVAELASHAVTQQDSDTAMKGGTSKAKALRTALVRDHMAVVARIAAVDLPASPELAALRMPRQPTVAKLVAAAHSMANTAREHRDVFLAAGLRERFIEDLISAADAVAAYASHRKQVKGQLVASTKAIQASLVVARRLVMVIDGMLQSELKDDAVLLSYWNNVKMPRRVPRQTTEVTPLPIAPAVAA